MYNLGFSCALRPEKLEVYYKNKYILEKLYATGSVNQVIGKIPNMIRRKWYNRETGQLHCRRRSEISQANSAWRVLDVLWGQPIKLI